MTESSLRQRAFCCFSLLSPKFVQKIASSTFVSVSKKQFFFISSSLSRAHFLRALARAYNITFFVRARAHAREKVTRIAIIDRPLSMIVGGRVGALFFIVCFLSVLEIQIERFCISPPAWQMNE